MDFVLTINLILQVIGGATILLNFVAPFTKNKADDKILSFFKKLLSIISLNVGEEESILKIRLKR